MSINGAKQLGLYVKDLLEGPSTITVSAEEEEVAET